MPRREYAINVARELRAKFAIDRPPVNAGLIVPYLPVRVVLEDWPDDVSGIFVRGEQISYIGLNANHTWNRRHFTLFHEIGHFLLHDDLYFCNFNAAIAHLGTAIEQEANAFAANVLMPESWVRPEYEKVNGNVKVLADRFAVSITAMQGRLNALGLRRQPSYYSGTNGRGGDKPLPPPDKRGVVDLRGYMGKLAQFCLSVGFIAAFV